MSKRPLVPAALALMAGLWFGRAVAVPRLAGGVALGVAFAAMLWCLMNWKDWRRTTGLIVFGFVLGVVRITPVAYPVLALNHLGHWADGASLTLEGRVAEPPLATLDGDGAFVLDVDKVQVAPDRWTRATGKIRVYVRHRLPTLSTGETIRVELAPQPVRSHRTPGVYDTAWLQAAEGVYLFGELRDGDDVVPVAPAPFGCSSLLDRLRGQLREAADRQPGWQPGLVRGLILGEQSVLDEQLYETFRRTGLIHVLVISGFNITAIAGLAYVLVWFLLTRVPRLALRLPVHRLATLAASIATVFYTLLVGASTSVLRACVMYLVLLLSIFLGRRRDLLNSLALAAIIVLLLTPGALWSSGFQYSFGAVLAMIHWRGLATRAGRWGEPDPLLPVAPLRNRVRRGALSGFVYTLAAYLATVPINLWHNGQLPTASLLANLIAVPMFSIGVVPLLLAGCVFAVGAPGLTALCWRGSEILADQVYGAALFLERIGLQSLQLGRPNWIEIALFVGLLIAAPYGRRPRVRRLALAGLVLLAVEPLLWFWHARQSREFSVTLLDVGQGLSLFVRGPRGKAMLIDGGYDPRGRTLTSFLSAQRQNHLDLVVATHPHPDHFHGLQAVLERFAVDEIWTIPLPQAYEETGRYLFMLDGARARGIPIRQMTRDTPTARVGEMQIEFLNPPSPSPVKWSLNELSLALRLGVDAHHALVTADMEQRAEESLLAWGREFRAGVVQVAHHGSRSSSGPAFVAGTWARHALVPVGYRNRYHLPNLDVMERWQAAAATVWRTDTDGAIECRAGTSGWNCRSIAPPLWNPLLRSP
jgi:competence protein ComEC